MTSSKRAWPLSAIGPRTMDARVLREGRDMRFAFIAKHRHVWPVSWLCAVLGRLAVGVPCLAEPASQRSGRLRQEARLGDATRASRTATAPMAPAVIWRDVLEDGLRLRPASHRAADAGERVLRRGLGAAGCRRTTASDPSSPTTSSTGTSRRTDRTRSGWPTSPTSGRPRAGSTSPPCWTCSHAALSAGR